MSHLHAAFLGYGVVKLAAPSVIEPRIPVVGCGHSQALLGTCAHVTEKLPSGTGVAVTGIISLIAQLATKPVLEDISSSVLNSTCKNLYSVVPVE
jgi:hypothetical protein